MILSKEEQFHYKLLGINTGGFFLWVTGEDILPRNLLLIYTELTKTDIDDQSCVPFKRIYETNTRQGFNIIKNDIRILLKSQNHVIDRLNKNYIEGDIIHKCHLLINPLNKHFDAHLKRSIINQSIYPYFKNPC